MKPIRLFDSDPKLRRSFMPHAALTLVFTTLLCVARAAPASAEAIAITQCGEVVAAGAVGYLTSDLDCRGSAGPGVVLEDRARLVLAGHTILGDPAETDDEGAPLQGVRCAAGSVCTLEGPGAIVGFSASGVAGTRVRLSELRIEGNAKAGVSAFENVRLRDVVFADNASVAVHAGGRVHARRADLGDEPQTAVAQWRAPLVVPGEEPAL